MYEKWAQAINPARLSLRPGAMRLKPLGFMNAETLDERSEDENDYGLFRKEMLHSYTNWK